MGSKAQRQGQHVKRLQSKIKKFTKKNKNVDGLQKELEYASGKNPRPAFKTGKEVDPRVKKSSSASTEAAQ